MCLSGTIAGISIGFGDETGELDLSQEVYHFIEADTSLQSALGEEFSAAYTKLRYHEWNKFARSLSQWERDNTLEC